jgi:ubiquinone/menaquinone biosynthesis C-methylase UbiE
MNQTSYYQEYARIAIEQYSKKDLASRYLLVDAIKDLEVKRVLDIGCGAGQELLPFAEKKDAFCVGIDIGEELGVVGHEVAKEFDCSEKINFSRSMGETLPFADQSFDVVLCRIALPYMHNQKTIAEVGRVLRSRGVFLLKTHSPLFFTDLLKDRIRTLNPKQIIYPLLCLFNGVLHDLTGKQFYKGFWNGKQVYQTKKILDREFSKHDLKIEGVLPDNNNQSPSYLVVKK